MIDSLGVRLQAKLYSAIFLAAGIAAGSIVAASELLYT